MKKHKWEPDGPEVARLRQVRREIEREFKTFDAYWKHFEKLDRERRFRTRKGPRKVLSRAS